MKPTVQSPDFYKIGNDYEQAPLTAFYDMTGLTGADLTAKACAILGVTAAPTETTAKGADYDLYQSYLALTARLQDEPVNYQDGIYTKLTATLADGEYSAAPFKNPEGFNKRRIYVDASDTPKDLKIGETFGIKDGVTAHTADVKQPKVDDEQYAQANVVVMPDDE